MDCSVLMTGQPCVHIFTRGVNMGRPCGMIGCKKHLTPEQKEAKLAKFRDYRLLRADKVKAKKVAALVKAQKRRQRKDWCRQQGIEFMDIYSGRDSSSSEDETPKEELPRYRCQHLFKYGIRAGEYCKGKPYILKSYQTYNDEKDLIMCKKHIKTGDSLAVNSRRVQFQYKTVVY